VSKPKRLSTFACTCSAMNDMFKALGPRLQRLTIGYDIDNTFNALGHNPDQCTVRDSLASSILRHCSQLAQLKLQHDLWPGDTAEVAAKTTVARQQRQQ
jgi:hypothetical protein